MFYRGVKEMKHLDCDDLANYIIACYNLQNVEVSNKKLQKVMFYCQAWSLALNDEKILDCRFEAWRHGAVIPSLYFKYSENGYNNLYIDNDKARDIVEEVQSHIPFRKLSIINKVLNHYAIYSGDELEDINHSEDPWIEARKGLQPHESSNRPISEELVKAYYRSRALEKGMKKMKKNKFEFSSTGLKKAQEKLREKDVFVFTKDNAKEYKDFILESRSKNVLFLDRAETAQMLQKR